MVIEDLRQPLGRLDIARENMWKVEAGNGGLVVERGWSVKH